MDTIPPRSPGRRVGDVASLIVNLALVWVAPRVDDWWPSLFTDRYDDALPWITASLLATAAVDLSWVLHDPDWWRHLAQMGLNALAVVVSLQIWDIFPFDVGGILRLGIRALLVVAIVGATIGVATEGGRLVRSGSRPASGRSAGRPMARR